MDNFGGNDPDDDEYVLKSMHNYVSVVNNLNLPNLDLDDDDLDYEDGLEPLVFHPVLDNGLKTNDQPSKGCPTPQQQKDTVKVSDNTELQAPETHALADVDEKPSQDNNAFTELKNADLAEMELDNAILSLAPSHSLDVVISQHSSGLSDSNSSSSSLLGKLEETMSVLRKESEREEKKINETCVDITAKIKDEQNTIDEPETVKLDLRHEQPENAVDLDNIKSDMATNHCVLLRYSSSPCNAADEDQENEDYRKRLKQESERITINKGKPASHEPASHEPVTSHEPVSYEPATSYDSNIEFADKSTLRKDKERLLFIDHPLSKGSMVNLGESVDSMLQNINRIISRGPDTGNASKDDSVERHVCKVDHTDKEYVQKYVVYDQKNGNESCISPDVYSNSVISSHISNDETQKKNVKDEKHGIVKALSQRKSTVDLEMNTELVGWGDMLAAEYAEDHNKVDICEEISDNIFTNAFFSSSKLPHDYEEKKPKPKMKRNILCTSRKKVSSTLKPDTDKESSPIANDDFPPKTDAPQKGIPDKAIKISNSQEVELTIFNQCDNTELLKCSNCGGDVSLCNGCLKEGIVANVENIVKGIKKEIQNHQVNGEISDTKLPADSIYRQLKYSTEKKKDITINSKLTDEKHVNNKVNDEKHECLACNIKNSGTETPMKHDESLCVNNNHIETRKVVRRVKKTSQSRGTSTNILNLIDANKTSQKKEKESTVDAGTINCVEETHSSEANKENSNEDPKNATIDVLPVPITNVSANNSKNRKKKKSKNKHASEKASPESITPVEPVVNNNNIHKKGLEHIDPFWKEIMQGGKETILFDEVMSFEQNYVSIPDIRKELLLLKVPLESPGVCKANNNEPIHTFYDQSHSDNFIGLVTLFVHLLRGSSKHETSMQNLDIPFDVVSLQQAHLDGELLLIVGVVENKNTYQQKTKRTKLGTNFFHAVSQFLNTNFLDKILSRIWEHTEGDLSRLQNSLPFNHIWRQVELTNKERCTIPGSGKLSSFINISPDTNALQRIYSLYPSLFVHTEEKTASGIPSEYSWYQPSGIQQDYTCITVEDAASISPKHLSELLKRLRRESVEVCGLRIGYSMKDRTFQTPTLSICINEFNAATANEGKLLLSDCEELKELAISFNAQDNISDNISVSGSPLLKYIINPQRSHRQVVQRFGPYYKDVNDLKATLAELKLNSKVSNNKNDKKKWALGSCQCRLSLLNSSLSSAVLFITALVPSAFISFVISLALKKGLSLKLAYKTCCSVNQLGFPEDKGDFLFYTDNDRRKGLVASRCMVSCMLLLFSGKSAPLRLLGLISKLTDILNNPLTGETLAPWLVDNLIKFNPSHNTGDNSGCKLSSVPKEYFGVLHFNDHMREILSTSFKPPRLHIVEDLYSILAKVQINFSKPETNLMAFLFYGDEILKEVPTILRIIFNECTYACLNSWRQSVRCRPFAVKYQPPIEFLGAKYINSINKLQAGNLIVQEYSETEVEKLRGNKAVLLMLKAIDKRTIHQICDNVSKHINSLKLDSSKSNFIVHTDTEYVFRLMFHFFELTELHGDQLKDETQIPPFCLPDNHVLFSVLDNVLDTHIHNQILVKKKLPDKDWKNILPFSDLPATSSVVQFSPSSLSFPLQMLLRCEKSYAGISFEYLPHNIQTISKAIARLCRMGFQISAFKFPCYDTNTRCCYVRVVFLREDAVFVLNKMVPELEANYPKLKFDYTETVHGVNSFVQNIFKSSSDNGGLFHCNYFALVNQLNFEKEECFEYRESQEVEWNPDNCNFENGTWYVKKESTSLSITGSLMASTDEVSVIILSEPLLSGRYLGKKLPENCVFPELLHVIESSSYRMIAGKMTMLTSEAADEILSIYDVDSRKKSRMVPVLSQEGGSFVVIALVGSCILSNFWLTVERKLADEEALAILKHHCLAPTKKTQVERLLVSLFDRVVPNTKVEIKTRLR